MSRTALIGHTGFVGSNLDRATQFDARYHSKTIAEIRGQEFDLVVCAAPQAKKWWANRYPQEDLVLIQELIRHLEQVKAQRFVLTSTIDVFPRITDADETFDCTSQDNHAYGKNRLQLEQFVTEHFPLTHIVRLPGLFGPGLKKNVIFDFLNQNEVEKINPDSQFQWYDVTQLWGHLETIMAENINLIVLATEPLRTAEIQTSFFPNLALGATPTPSVAYNIRTCHDKVFGGSDGYIMSKEAVLHQIGQFVAKYPEI